MGLNGDSVGPGCLVVVSGPPGGGKTDLARPLAAALDVAFLSKDEIKEALFDELGTGDRLWARRLGRASFAVLYRLASATPVGLVEAVFQRDAALADLAALDRPLVEVHCRCEPELALERFQQRATTERHPGHLDHRQPRNKLEQLIDDCSAPLGLGGSLLEVDTDGSVDVEQVAAWVRATPEWTARAG
jgi:hypothetical protein